MSSKLTALTALSPILSTDIIYVVSAPGGTPASKKGTIANVLASAGLSRALGVLVFDPDDTATTQIKFSTSGLTSNRTYTFPDVDSLLMSSSGSGISLTFPGALSIASGKTL